MESVGFKEWAVICEALGRGRQSIIIRKGGIAEGRDGFSFRHREFFLFPTWFHGADEKVRDFAFDYGPTSEGTIALRYFARVDVAATITAWPVAESLQSLHILQRDVVRERFEYKAMPGLHVAFVRVFQLHPPWVVPDEQRFAGCRSWIEMPEPPELRRQAVLSDLEHERRRNEFTALTEKEGGLEALRQP
jgi:hypothetical protein